MPGFVAVLGARPNATGTPGTTQPYATYDFRNRTTLPSGVTLKNPTTVMSYIDSNMNIVYVGPDTPRFEFQAVGQPLGLLIEPQRTNLIAQTESIDDVKWFKGNTTLTANNVTAPDTQTTAEKFVASSSATPRIAQAVNVTGNVKYVHTAFVKWLSGDAFFDSLVQNGTNLSELVYNMRTGAIDTTNSKATGFTQNSKGVSQLANGWFRPIQVITPAASYSAGAGGFSESSASSKAATTNSSFSYWGEQIELGDFATSYIPARTTVTAGNATDPTGGSGGGGGTTPGTIPNKVLNLNINYGAYNPNERAVPTLDEVRTQAPKYNWVDYAFGYCDGGTGLTVETGNGYSTADIQGYIKRWHDAGKIVVLAIGGGGLPGPGLSNQTNANNFAQTISDACSTYGFDGIDWDLEANGPFSGNPTWTVDWLAATNRRLKTLRGNSFLTCAIPRSYEMDSGHPQNIWYDYFAANGHADFDLVQIQFYDGDFASQTTLEQFSPRVIHEAVVNLKIPETKLVFGGEAPGGGDGWRPTRDYLSVFQKIKSGGFGYAAHPNLRGAFVWDGVRERASDSADSDFTSYNFHRLFAPELGL